MCSFIANGMLDTPAPIREEGVSTCWYLNGRLLGNSWCCWYGFRYRCCSEGWYQRCPTAVGWIVRVLVRGRSSLGSTANTSGGQNHPKTFENTSLKGIRPSHWWWFNVFSTSWRTTLWFRKRFCFWLRFSVFYFFLLFWKWNCFNFFKSFEQYLKFEIPADQVKVEVDVFQISYPNEKKRNISSWNKNLNNRFLKDFEIFFCRDS